MADMKYLPSTTDERFREGAPAICPVSGLAVRMEPDWVYRSPQGSYETSFALIGTRIILVTAKGYVEEADMRHAIALADAITRDVFPPGTRYVQLEGLLGAFVFGLPPFFRLSFNLTRRLGLHRHKVHVVSDYETAIHAAVALTGADSAMETTRRRPPSRGQATRGQGGDRRRTQPPPLQPIPTEGPYREQVNYLLEFLGGIDPEEPGIQRRRKVDGGPHSPLEPVYEAIALMKRDMDFLVGEQRRTLEVLSRRRDELQHKSAELEYQNRELRHLLQQNAVDSREVEVGVVRNAHRILKPLILAMRENRPQPAQAACLDRLARQVDELLDSFVPRLDSVQFSLTAQELRVARLIRDGYSSRQIAARLGVATRTVTTHRTQIRTKLGLKGRRRNLRTSLLAIPDDRFDGGRLI
jgi:DNA-binding CsgD family transcriptional regulator